jgi:DNA-binding phage protein
MAQRQLQDPDLTMAEVAQAFHVSRTTLYRALKKAGRG